ncbi:MAG: glycosyl hydrolase family 28-related protein [Planctomycetia bacterium]
MGNVRIKNLNGNGLVIGTRKVSIPSWIIFLDRLDIQVQGDHHSLHMAGTDGFLTNCRFAGGLGALHTGGGNVGSNLVFENSSGAGLTQRNGGVSMVDSIFRNNATSGLMLAGPAVSAYGGNRFENNLEADVALEQARHATLANNVFLTASPKSGKNLAFQGSSHVAIVGNRFAVPAQPLPDDHSACAENVFGVADGGPATAPALRPDQVQKIYAVQGRSGGWLITDVKSQGAVGDGTTDDAPAIQKAIDSVAAGSVIFFPVGTYLVRLPLVLRSGITLLGEGNRQKTSLIRAAEGLPAAVHTPSPVSDVLITRLTFGKAGILDLSRLKDSVVDMVVAGEIHLGADTAGVVLNACQLERGVRLAGGRGNVLNSLYTREVTAQGGVGHVIRCCNIDLSRAASAVTFTAPQGEGTRMTVRNCYLQLHDQRVIAFDYDAPHQADARIDSCIFRSNGTFRTSRARIEDFDTNLDAVKNGVPMEVKEAIPEVFVRNGRNITITNNVIDYYEHLDPVDIRKDFLVTVGDVDAVSVIGNKLRESRDGPPGGQSRLEHNVAGQVMPQPNVAPLPPPPAPPPPAPPAAAFSFAPNQLAGSPWYRPGDQNRAINGHLDESFGRRERWPILLGHLKTHHGAFGITAAEISHLKDSGGLLALLRSEGIPVSLEIPAFTQPLDAVQLARAEILGEAVDGVNIFASIFRIDAPHDRPNPFGSGWFVTSDGTPFIPDEIMFDERIPNLLPDFDAALLAQTQGSWEERKQAARKLHPFMASRQPYNRLLESLMQDYVRYLEVARAHWGDRMPAVSLHWNVNSGWEERDETGLDAIHAANPAWCQTPEDFYRIVFTSPQYNSVRYLDQLLDVLNTAGIKVRTVFMDVDWNYSLPYVTEVLRRHKSSLATRGVQMGINLVEAGLGEQDELVSDGHTLQRRVDPDTSPNVLYENTLVAIMDYLRVSGIYEPGMQIRVGSWSRRPAETGGEVDETRPGSLARTANRIMGTPP